jgi:signal transduction histidine kinase/ActR/RegA family two-component response regulator
MFVLSQQRLKRCPRIVAIAIVALVYYGTAELSRHVAATPQSVTPVWPPDGFAAAAVMIWGLQILPGILVGSFLANIWAFFNGESLYVGIVSVLQVLGIAIGTTIGAGLGNYLLRQMIKGRNPFRRLSDVYQFLGFTGVLAPMINATIGVVCLCLGGRLPWSMFGSTWLTWCISNMAGIYIFTPAILSWYELYFKASKKINSNSNSKAEAKPIRIRLIIEAIVLTTIVVGISFLSFYQDYDLEYTLIPCLIWSVVRFGRFGTTNLVVIITMIAILGTVRGLGTFSINHSDHSLVLLQYFIITIVVAILSLIAILSEKQEVIAKLQISKTRLINQSKQLESSKLVLKENTLILAQQNLDLTEAKKVAEKANRTKTEFLSNMSHELRTPLNGILGFVQLLQDSKHLDSQDQADLLAIYQSGIHLLNLINDILDIAKIEAGKMNLQLQDVHFPSFLQDLVAVIQVQATRKNIDFIYQFSPDLPQLIHVDDQRLRQILLNLLGNAIKFCEQGQVIFKVSCSQPCHQNSCDQNPEITKSLIAINFEVKDSGIGLESDRLESIFLPFEQFGESKFQSQGTGLGLPISQKIVEMMGSKITVSSQKGVGSVFQFTVNLQVIEPPPLDQQDISIVSNKSTFDQKLAQKLPLRILLAEDNTVNQRVACKILDRLGYKVDVVADGLQVLEAMRLRAYDVVLMDVQMPEMDGIEATKHMINDRTLAYCPYIIALTANAMDSDRYFCMEAGMNDFISKPINVELLVEALWRSQKT